MAGGNVLSVEGLTKRFGERLIFEDLHFGLDQGQKAALVARNGTGKSTLMKVLLGVEGADAGKVTFSGKAKIAHLSQEHGLDLDRTILDNLFHADNAAMRAIRNYEEATKGDDAEALQKEGGSKKPTQPMLCLAEALWLGGSFGGTKSKVRLFIGCSYIVFVN